MLLRLSLVAVGEGHVIVGASLGISSCGMWASLLGGMWTPPRPGIEPMSPTLSGRLLSTVPLRNSPTLTLHSFTHSFRTSSFFCLFFLSCTAQLVGSHDPNQDRSQATAVKTRSPNQEATKGTP